MSVGAGPPLVGRERELRIIHEALESVCERGAALILRGEPGVGKSTLLDRAAEEATRLGMRILRTAGVQSEAEMPFAGLHQLLRPIMGHTDGLPVAQRDALAAAFGSTTEAPELFLVALAALSLLSDLATPSPIVAIADDAQWLDDETCDVLTFVGRRLESDPILLLISSREGSEAAFDTAGLPRISVDPLDAASAAILLEQSSPGLPSAARARILSEAAGNPLALVELPLAWEQHTRQEQALEWIPLTKRLERTFAARARALPEVTRTLLLTAALNPTGSLSETLEATSLASRTNASLDDIAPAEQVRLVVLQQDALEFRHPLIRSAILQATSMSERHAANASLAEVLKGRDDRWIWHRAACTVGTDEAVAAELEATASSLQHRAGGAVIASAALQRAAQLTPDVAQRGRRLLAAAELAHAIGRGEMAGRLVAEARTLNLDAVDHRRLAWLEEFLQQGKGSGTVSALVTVAEELRMDGRTEMALRCLETTAQKCWWSDSYQADRELVLAATDRLPQENQGSARALAIRLFCDPVNPGLIEAAHAYADSKNRPISELNAAIRLGAALTTVPDPVTAREILSAALARARTEGRAGLACEALVSLGDAALYSGDLTLSLRSADECARLADEMRRPTTSAFARLTQACVLGVRGQEERATELLVEAEAFMVALGFKPWACFLEIAWATIALASGRYEDAFSHLHRTFDPNHRAFDPLIGSRGLMDLVEAGLRTNQGEQTLAAVDQIDLIARRGHSPFLEMSVQYARVLLADNEEADALFEAVTAPGHSPFLRARLLLHHGTRLRRQRRVTEARALLRSACSTFDGLGAVPWADRARAELRASGEKSQRRISSDRDQLTPQELQIAHMAASGLTNREIGQRLFLSHRTVGSHLYRIFPKLSVSSRTELIGALAQDTVSDAQPRS